MTDHKLTIADMEPLVARVGKRAAPWQGRFMSSAARLTLTDACLSNLQTHAMGLFLFADGVHAGFDKHRSKFFWEGHGTKKKYHLIKWSEICKPKDQGGFGVLGRRKMNLALMVKWIWRLISDDNNNLLWVRILKASSSSPNQQIALHFGIVCTKSNSFLSWELDSTRGEPPRCVSGRMSGLEKRHWCKAFPTYLRSVQILT
jgi:hypothetical protein